MEVVVQGQNYKSIVELVLFFTIEIIFLPKLNNTHASKCEKINLNKEFKGLTLRRLLISGWVFTNFMVLHEGFI